MKVRIVNYRLSLGGGDRFLVQVMKALQAAADPPDLELVGHGPLLAGLRKQFDDYGIRCAILDMPGRPEKRTGGFERATIAPEAIAGGDVIWFPWVHHHRFPADLGQRVVGSFHDGLIFTEPTLALPNPEAAAEERETIRQWLASEATIVCSSHCWINSLKDGFVCRDDRLHLIPIAGNHAPFPAAPPAAGRWSWLSAPFLLCPANTTAHKNHEVLLEGYARSGVSWPLVLTGAGADLVDPQPSFRGFLRNVAVVIGRRPPLRGAVLRRLAHTLGLRLGTSLIPLGFLAAADYEAVIDRAACVVMPTLGEGGGSFPVAEAVLRGVPVICSDIPVLREQMTRLGAEVLWFDPKQPAALAERLLELRSQYAVIKAKAISQVERLHRRRWSDVATEYLQIFRAVADRRT